MRIKILAGVLLIALLSTVSLAWVSDSSPLPAKDQVEQVILTYAWSMDEPDKATWLSVFSDDLENYTVSVDGVPVIDVANAHTDMQLLGLLLYLRLGYPPSPQEFGAFMAEFTAMTVKERLAEMSGMMIFDRVVVGQSSLSNIMVNVTGNAASGRDYFRHWEIVDPTHPANLGQGMDDNYWYFQEGKHWYDLEKEGDDWKIVKFEGLLLRSEAREIQ